MPAQLWVPGLPTGAGDWSIGAVGMMERALEDPSVLLLQVSRLDVIVAKQARKVPVRECAAIPVRPWRLGDLLEGG